MSKLKNLAVDAMRVECAEALEALKADAEAFQARYAKVAALREWLYERGRSFQNRGDTEGGVGWFRLGESAAMAPPETSPTLGDITVAMAHWAGRFASLTTDEASR